MRYSLVRRLGRGAQIICEHCGHFLHRHAKYGIDPFHDVGKLSNAWQTDVSIVFDVGANNGSTSYKLRQRFPKATLHAFEPHPQTFKELQQSARQLDDIHCHELALGNRVGPAPLFAYEMSVINSLKPDAQYANLHNMAAHQIEIACSTLDQFCFEHEINRVDLLKIDVEGAELDVISGAESMLARGAIRFVFFEFNDIEPQLGSSGGGLRPIDERLRPHGFRFVGSYNQHVLTNGMFFLVSNALYARQPSGPNNHASVGSQNGPMSC